MEKNEYETNLEENSSDNRENESDNINASNHITDGLELLLHKVVFDVDENVAKLIYKIGNDKYILNVKYEMGIMEYVYNQKSRNLTSDFKMIKRSNNTNYEIESYVEFEDKILDDTDFLDIELLEKKAKKLVIRIKKDKLYLDVEYTYKYQKEEEKTRKKTYKMTHDITNCIPKTKKLLSYYTESLEYNSLNDLIKDNKIVKFKRKAYQRFKDEYQQLVNEEEIEKTEEENVEERTEQRENEDKEARNPIGKIVFYKYTTDIGETIVKAVIFYKDGSSETVSEKEGNICIEILGKMLEKNRDELEKEGYIHNEVLEENIFANNRENFTEEAMRRSKENENSTETIKKAKKKKSKSLLKKVLVAGSALLAVAGVAVAVTLGLKHAKKEQASPDDSSTNSSTNVDNNTPDENEQKLNYDYGNCTWNQMVDLCRSNKERRSNMLILKQFLTHHNERLANTYAQENSEVRTCHSFKEAEAYYLACNKKTPDKIYEYFGKTKISAEKLMKNLQKFIKQAAMFHNIQTLSSEKDTYLLQNENVKQMYKAYDDKFTSMNTTSDIRQKIKNIEDVYTMVREDLPGMQLGDYSKVSSAEAVIITEFVSSLKNIKGLEISNKFSESEQSYIDNLLTSVVTNKFKKMENKQNMRLLGDRQVESLVYEDEAVPGYKDMMGKLTEKLQADGIYNVNKEERDISTYKSYQKNTDLKMPTIDENTSTVSRIEEKEVKKEKILASKENENIQEQKEDNPQNTTKNETTDSRKENTVTEVADANKKGEEQTKVETTIGKLQDTRRDDSIDLAVGTLTDYQEKHAVDEFVQQAETANQNLYNRFNNSVGEESKEDNNTDDKSFVEDNNKQDDLLGSNVGNTDQIVDDTENQETQDQIQNDLPEYSLEDIESEQTASQSMQYVNDPYVTYLYVGMMENSVANQENTSEESMTYSK